MTARISTVDTRIIKDWKLQKFTKPRNFFHVVFSHGVLYLMKYSINACIIKHRGEAELRNTLTYQLKAKILTDNWNNGQRMWLTFGIVAPAVMTWKPRCQDICMALKMKNKRRQNASLQWRSQTNFGPDRTETISHILRFSLTLTLTSRMVHFFLKNR